MKAKFYEGKLWKEELEHLLMPMLEKWDVVLVDDPENKVAVVKTGTRCHFEQGVRYRRHPRASLSRFQCLIVLSRLNHRQPGSVFRP